MKKLLTSFFILISLCVLNYAQSTTENSNQTATSIEAKPKKPIFRANKDQILQAQKILKLSETGKLSKDDKVVLKSYQTDNGLKANGSLNRATLEKMGINLTEKQKEIPVDPNSFAKLKTKETKTKKAVFKATKDLID